MTPSVWKTLGFGLLIAAVTAALLLSVDGRILPPNKAEWICTKTSTVTVMRPMSLGSGVVMIPADWVEKCIEYKRTEVKS
jgi:hypothetical protein